jgi:tetratricopeptide (TPR) repeat protein
MNLAVVHYFAGRYDRALKALEETIDLDPDFGQAYVMRGRVFVAQGMPEKAVEELKLAHSRMGDRPDVITPLAYVLAKAGRKREARETLAELRRIAKPQDPAPIRLAIVHIGLGEMNEAFVELQNAVKARDWQLGMLKVEPLFDDLRSDPRFASLLDSVGLAR